MLSILRHAEHAYVQNKSAHGSRGWAVFVTWLLGALAAFGLLSGAACAMGLRNWPSVLLDTASLMLALLLMRLVFLFIERRLARKSDVGGGRDDCGQNAARGGEE